MNNLTAMWLICGGIHAGIFIEHTKKYDPGLYANREAML